MTTAIDFAFPTEGAGGALPLGLRVAIDDLLRSWFRYGGQNPFVFRPHDEKALAHLRALAASCGIDPDLSCVALDPRTPGQNLGTVSTLFRPDPALAEAAWTRQQLPGRGYSLCGLLHTLSGDQAARVLHDVLLAPVDETDALICPSHAIRKAAHALWEIAGSYLDHRFGGKHVCPIQTPVIPLGVDAAKLAALRTPEKRAAQRAALGVDEDEVLILFTGRLSFVTKAHPLALIEAARLAAEKSGKKIRLVFFGYYQPQAEMQPRFTELVRDMAGPLACDLITNDDPRFPDGLWAAADIFASLVDNIQESFGLTPIEAMGCGLPVVVTDWDGYRDGVLHGKTGYLIPTGAPPVAAGLEIAEAYYNNRNYGLYLAGSSQSTYVAIPAAAEAFATLALDGDLRRTMGAAAQAHVRATYDWASLIPAYRELWQDLSERRRLGPKPQPLPQNWPAAHPAFLNPYAVFESFPTVALSLKLRLRAGVTNDRISLILNHDMNCFVPELLLPIPAIRQMVEAIRERSVLPVEELLRFITDPDKPRFWRTLGWMLKHELCIAEAD